MGETAYRTTTVVEEGLCGFGGRSYYRLDIHHEKTHIYDEYIFAVVTNPFMITYIRLEA